MADVILEVEISDQTRSAAKSIQDRLEDLEKTADQVGEGIEGSLEDAASGGKDAFSGFGLELGGLTDGLEKFAGPAAIGAAVAGVGAFALNTFNATQEISQLSNISRINTEDLQAYGIVAERSGGSIEDVADASRELQLRLSEAASLGSGPAVDALNLLGVSLQDIQNLKPEESFALIRDRISEIEDPAQRAFVAEELLGGATERLTGFLELNAGAFREQTEAVRESGAVISEEAVAKGAEAAEAITDLTNTVTGLAQELVLELAPAITATSGLVQEATEAGFELDFSWTGIVGSATNIADTIAQSLIPSYRGAIEAQQQAESTARSVASGVDHVYSSITRVTPEVTKHTTDIYDLTAAYNQAYGAVLRYNNEVFRAARDNTAFSGATPSQFDETGVPRGTTPVGGGDISTQALVHGAGVRLAGRDTTATDVAIRRHQAGQQGFAEFLGVGESGQPSTVVLQVDGRELGRATLPTTQDALLTGELDVQ